MTKDLNTENKILAAAKSVFQKRGMAGSRMQAIADEAGINKALLHYYFRSKEKLFEAIFGEALTIMVPKANAIFNADLPLFEKIELFVTDYIDLISEHPHIPAFVLHEINQNPEGFLKLLQGKKDKPNPGKLLMQIQQEIAEGKIIKIEPLQLFVNMIALCVFPFIAKPMLKGFLSIPDKAYDGFIQNRKKEVTTFIINAIKK